MPKKRLLIDADYLVYTMGYASEQKVKWADDSVTKTANLPMAQKLIMKKVERLLHLFDTDEYILVMSGSGNWRYDIFPEYKQNRVVLTKPVCYNEIRNWLASLEETIVVNGEEADDWLAVQVSCGSLEFDDIIVSADKDFFTACGSLYNLTSKRLFHISQEQSLCFLMFQAMAGDRVDGYHGVPWLGEAKVTRLLQACQGKSIRAAYLFIKSQIFKRGKTLDEKRENWKQFRLCLDLAALRWFLEIPGHGIGLRRIFKYREFEFEYFLPYYDIHQTVKFGELIEPNWGSFY